MRPTESLSWCYCRRGCVSHTLKTRNSRKTHSLPMQPAALSAFVGCIGRDWRDHSACVCVCVCVCVPALF
jgi:hypothetical protein